jgi:vacuolar-type H+-ATPase subunit H
MADENSDTRKPFIGGSTSVPNDAGLGARNDPQRASGEFGASSGANRDIGSDDSGSADMKRTASGMADEVKSYVEDATSQAKEQGRSMFEEQKENAAAQADTVAHAFRKTASQLQGENNSPAGRYINLAADQVESLGRRLREKDMDAIFRDVEDLARRSPGPFFAGSLVAGFLFARFLKSSSQHRQEQDDRDYERAYSPQADEDFESTARRSWSSNVDQEFRPASPMDNPSVSSSTGVDSSATAGGAGSGSTSSAGTTTGNIGADGTATGTPLPSSTQAQPGGDTYGNR